MEPELIADDNCLTGEGPLWHAQEQRLYWIDIPTGRLFRYDPASGAHEPCYKSDAAIGGFTIQADGSLLLFMARGNVQTWHEGETATVIEDIPQERDSRFNDVIADPRGRVFCGTMSTESQLGRLYRLDCDGELIVVLEGIGCSNGMGFAPDQKQMYYTDSRAREIYLYDYDAASGAITNRRVFVRIPDGEGVPDGLTVDAEGYVWSALWGGSCVVRFAPDGQEVARIPFPAKQVSCVTFGGTDYADMYVTTAGGNDKAEQGAGAGALFRVHPGIQGVPEFLSRVGLPKSGPGKRDSGE